MTTDQIQKEILLRAPLHRVWDAISDSAQFGAWFGAAFEGPFVAGTRVQGKIVPTTVDPEVAKAQEEFDGMPFACQIEAVEPMTRLAFRWNPTIDGAGGLDGPTTLVTFELEEASGGTRLRVTESGFDSVPLAERAATFARNAEGWEAQAHMIQTYLARGA